MADETVAAIIPLHQPNRPKTGAERAKAYRQRKRNKAKAAVAPDQEARSPQTLVSPGPLLAEPVATEPSVTLQTSETVRPVEPVTPARCDVASIVLSTAAFALAAAGITINGWFARSLGSSDLAGWLFLAIGVAADAVALVMPSCAASLWQARQRVTAALSWAVWAVTFVFAVTAGIGFASTNISDVTLARASRVTPAVTSAQTALTDAMVARDRECRGGVGKFCRDREAEVTERRQVLDTAMASVGQSADPQTDAAIKLVAWVSHGLLRPAPEDFAMLRLVLLALLPQIGGILLMVGRVPMVTVPFRAMGSVTPTTRLPSEEI
jgi:hypothetical protein